MPSDTKTAAALSFTCASCGSHMCFDPDTQGLKCSHCGRVDVIPAPLIEAPEYSYDPKTASYDAPDWEGMEGISVRCKGCGAQTIIPADATTASCPFCGSQYVVDDTAIPGIKPESVMPFKISRDKAVEMFRTWTKGEFMAPGAFRKKSHDVDNLTGVYVPFWTYDAELHTSYTADIGEDHTVTKTRVVDGKKETYTETYTTWYPISGEDSGSFDDRIICATDRLDNRMIGQLGTFSTKVLNRYAPAFLAGFTAERYTLGVREGWEKLIPGMQYEMEKKIISSLPGNRQRNVVYRHTFSNVRFKHILLPIWINSYRYKKKIYRFMINGETGEMMGDSPFSWLKLLAAFGIIIGAIVLVLFIVYLLGRTA